MYPDDRVLVCFVPEPADFERIKRDGWYRVPQKHAPKGLHAEYFAFYFGRKFGPEKWAIHYYARQTGHELLTRKDLLPEQPDHPRAEELYYKVALGALTKLDEPVVSLRWRRVTFIHTTWDRFREAREINDLFLEGGEFLDRLYIALKEQGLRPERNYQVKETAGNYNVPIAVLCENGRIEIGPQEIPGSELELKRIVSEVLTQVGQRGGLRRRS